MCLYLPVYKKIMRPPFNIIFIILFDYSDYVSLDCNKSCLSITVSEIQIADRQTDIQPKFSRYVDK